MCNAKKRPLSSGSGTRTSTPLQGWVDGDDNCSEGAFCRDEEEDTVDKILIRLEIREAINVPPAIARTTGECYVELHRRTQRGTLAKLNPKQSRVRTVKTPREKRTWSDDKKQGRAIRWSPAQSIDVEASLGDSLILSLWDYKQIGESLKVGYARLECSDITLGGNTEVRSMSLCDKDGQDVFDSNGQTAEVVVSIKAVLIPAVAAERVEKEFGIEEPSTPAASSQSRRSVTPPRAIATPLLDSIMMKLGSRCEHAGKALVFLGLDCDGRLSARHIAAGMDNLGHHEVDLDVLGRELMLVCPSPAALSAGTLRGTSWSLSTDRFTEIFNSRVPQTRKKAPLPQDIETDNTPRAFNQKQKLRRAEDALAKKDAEIRSLRFAVAALKEQVEETRVETSQDHMSYYAAEDAIKMLSEVEKANEALVKQLADLKIQSGEAVALKKRVEVLEAAHRGMQEQIDRGNQANARLLQERKGLELRLEKYEEEFGLHAPIRTTNWLSETTVGSKRTQQRFALAAALAQLEAAELTCNAIVNGSIFSPAGDT